MRNSNLSLVAIRFLIFTILTLVTQIGGVVYLMAIYFYKRFSIEKTRMKVSVAMVLYLLMSYSVVPLLATFLGRERVNITEKIRPTSYITVLLNRNYVKPEMNELLAKTEKVLKDTHIEIRFLDANFPFFDGFPLLPHLSHKDREKLDLSLVYEESNGRIVNEKRSRTGYGVFEEPDDTEYNQTEDCKSKGYFQYDYPKYLTLGEINKDLNFSSNGTKKLIGALLSNTELGKMFIEPHLKTRLSLTDSRVKFHGCGAVRHDDHIHIQLK